MEVTVKLRTVLRRVPTDAHRLLTGKMRQAVTPPTPVKALTPTPAEVAEAAEAVTMAMTVTGTETRRGDHRNVAATAELHPAAEHHPAAAEEAAAVPQTASHLEEVEAAEAAEAADADGDVRLKTTTRPTRCPKANQTRRPNSNNRRFGIRSSGTRCTTFDGFR